MKKYAALLMLLTVASGSLFAESPAVWKADISHSRVDFNVTHLVISEVTGRFTDFAVTLQQGNEDFTGSIVEATIRTATINTDNEKRDAHLRSDDFLNAAKFPEMTFKSKSFEKNSDGTYTIVGDLTIRDVTKEVTLTGSFKGSVKTPWGDERAGFVATTVINRFDYGVKWANTMDSGGLVAGKDITITLRVELVKQK